MRKLRRPAGAKPGGRAAVVVPNGTLFGDGVCARIKQELLQNFNLHTIVRLPNGVFAPYTSIPTNLLFFERPGPTREIWYYEHTLPESQKNYTKTKPLRDEEFAPLKAWWGGRQRAGRQETQQAWRVPVEKIAGFNLDLKNPNAAPDYEHLPPDQLLESIIDKEKHILEILEDVRGLVRDGIR